MSLETSIESGVSRTQRSMAYEGALPDADEGATHATIVRRTIENEIFSGRLPPGSQIDEDEIAKRFSISRTPVREALLVLTQNGLLEKLPRRGAIVARLNLSRMIQLFEVTAQLEGLCAQYAATRMTPDERKLLVEINDKAEQALAENNASEYGRLGGRFHALIMLSSHNSVLVETTDRLALHTLPYRRFQVRMEGRSQSNQNDHERILEAILAKDGDEAAKRMRLHVMVQGNVLAEYISSTES